MIALLADENFNNDILRGVRRRIPNVDVVRVQDVGLSGLADTVVLAWAADERRVVSTHDVRAMIEDAKDRLRGGLVMAGLIAVPKSVGIGVAVENVSLMAVATDPHEWVGRIDFVPL